jgi:uncharacterized protein (DUF736 family)
MAPFALTFEATPEVEAPRIGLRSTTGQATAWLHRIDGDAQACRYEGELKTLSVRAEISILPVAHEGSPNQPGYRVRLDGIEVAAGWHRTDLASRKEYVSLSPSRGRGRSTPISPGPGVKARPDVFALIWNLRLERWLASKNVSARNRSVRRCSAAGSRASVGTPGNRRTQSAR